MNNTLLTTAASLLLFLPSLVSAKPKTLENVALAYTPTTTIGEKDAVDLTGLLKVKIEMGAFTDVRTDPARIAENREDADKGKIRIVTTPDDVGAWIQARFAEELGRYGFSVVPSGGDVVISGEIRRFFVTETGTYQADVGILLTMKDAAGNELWQGMANGSAERFGRSYKLENYQEAWSDGLFEAIYSLVSSVELRQALRKQ